MRSHKIRGSGDENAKRKGKEKMIPKPNYKLKLSTVFPLEIPSKKKLVIVLQKPSAWLVFAISEWLSSLLLANISLNLRYSIVKKYWIFRRFVPAYPRQ